MIIYNIKDHLHRPGCHPSPAAAPAPSERRPAHLVIVADGRRGRAHLRELAQARRLRIHYLRAQDEWRKRVLRQRQRLRQRRRERGRSWQHFAEVTAQADAYPDDRAPRVALESLDPMVLSVKKRL